MGKTAYSGRGSQTFIIFRVWWCNNEDRVEANMHINGHNADSGE